MKKIFKTLLRVGLYLLIGLILTMFAFQFSPVHGIDPQLLLGVQNRYEGGQVCILSGLPLGFSYKFVRTTGMVGFPVGFSCPAGFDIPILILDVFFWAIIAAIAMFLFDCIRKSN